jgi:hypothetical protein
MIRESGRASPGNVCATAVGFRPPIGAAEAGEDPGLQPMATADRTVRLQQDTYDLLVTDAVDQRQQLGEVVAVAAGERDRQRLARRRATRARSALAASNPALVSAGAGTA